jgi:2-oxoglutarate ferredoxin oxidoreductase subunit alpha
MTTADPTGVLTGVHYFDGDFSCAEGALAAGCRFFAGYPITPSTEVAERFAQRIPKIGGIFIQMEDELGSIAAVLGAAWGGLKAMTVTSGPGMSLMLENIGLAAMMEVPCVIANVQRGGPSTGLPTMVGQADMMQARWGSHGDYRIIALCPDSPQESFDLTIEAFNLAEHYRVPVLVMLDESVGHMFEKVVIPSADKIAIRPRRYTTKPPSEYLPYQPEEDLVPDMVKAGDGYRFHTTGLTHDERGYPVMSAEAQDKLVRRLVDKIRLAAPDLVKVESNYLEDAEIVVVAYGITSRVARMAVEEVRKQGVKAGLLRFLIVWPFPENLIRDLAARIKAFVVPEINYGQIVFEVERCSAGRAPAISVPHMGGTVHDPEVIEKAILEAAK